MKTFTYEVAGFEWTDTTAWGEAWRTAKAYAADRHAAIYRTDNRGEANEERLVYCTAGIFLNIEDAKPESVKIW